MKYFYTKIGSLIWLIIAPTLKKAKCSDKYKQSRNIAEISAVSRGDAVNQLKSIAANESLIFSGSEDVF